MLKKGNVSTLFSIKAYIERILRLYKNNDEFFGFFYEIMYITAMAITMLKICNTNTRYNINRNTLEPAESNIELI